MARLFSSLPVSGLVVLLVACGDADGGSLFEASTPPTALATGAGGNDPTTEGQGGTEDTEGGQGEGGHSTSGSGGAGKSGTSGEGAGGDDPGTGGEGGTDPGVFGGNGGDPGAGGTESGGTGDGGTESGGQSAGGKPGVGGQAPQGGGGKPQGPGGQGPQGGGGKGPGGASGSGGSGQGGKAGSSGQAGKAGSSGKGGATTGDGVECAMSEDDSVIGACKGGGKGCCLDSENANPCVTSDQCPVNDQENSYFGFLGCDGPEDCNGGQCCIGQKNYNAQCRSSCNQGENPMCHPGVGGLLGCNTLGGKSCQPISEGKFDTGGIYHECR